MSAPSARERMAAWQAAMQFCPFCSGLGTQDNGNPCAHCLHSPGSLFESLLIEAHERGRDEVNTAVEGAIKQVDAHAPTTRELRGAV